VITSGSACVDVDTCVRVVWDDDDATSSCIGIVVDTVPLVATDDDEDDDGVIKHKSRAE